MADIVNLRMARKRKARKDKEAEAAANRALHGRTKGEWLRDAKTADTLRGFVDGHLRERKDDEQGR